MNIKPIRSYLTRLNKLTTKACFESEVRELEANYKEAIECLRELTLESMSRYEHLYTKVEDLIDIYSDQFDIIEKATGKKWEELVK